MIIGISGKKRHGKNTVAKMIQQHYDSYTIAYADPLKKVCMDLWNLSYDQLFGDELKEVVDPRWGKSPRQIMQQFGDGGVRAIHPDTWTRLLIQNIKDAEAGKMPWLHDIDARAFLPAPTNIKLWCVSDVRYPNEADTIRQEGGVILKVIRPDMIISEDNHASETSIDLIEPDHTVFNRDLKQLETDVMAWVKQVLR